MDFDKLFDDLKNEKGDIQLEIIKENTEETLIMYCHSFVLCLLPYFRKQIMGNFKKSDKLTIYLPDHKVGKFVVESLVDHKLDPRDLNPRDLNPRDVLYYYLCCNAMSIAVKDYELLEYKCFDKSHFDLLLRMADIMNYEGFIVEELLKCTPTDPNILKDYLTNNPGLLQFLWENSFVSPSMNRESIFSRGYRLELSEDFQNIKEIVYSPNGKKMAISFSKKIEVWDREELKKEKTFNLLDGCCLSYSPNNHLIFLEYDKVNIYWDCGKLTTYKVPCGKKVILSSDDKHICIMDPYHISVWQLDGYEIKKISEINALGKNFGILDQSRFTAIQFYGDDDIIYGDEEATVHSTTGYINSIYCPKYTHTSIQNIICPRNNPDVVCAYLADSGEARIKYKLLHYDIPKESISAIEFSEDDQYLIIMDRYNQYHAWDIKEKTIKILDFDDPIIPHQIRALRNGLPSKLTFVLHQYFK